MKYIAFQKHLSPLSIFSSTDIRKNFENYDSRRLYEWQQKGYIIKIRNNYYTFTDVVRSEETLFLASNIIYSPSYVSLESALSFYGVIPEGVYTITSISTKKTYFLDTPIGKFSYRNLKSILFFGYHLISFKDRKIKIVSLEKTILDFLYLSNNITSVADFESLRWNIEVLKKLDFTKIETYLEIFTSEVLRKRVKILTEYIYNA